jgi:hypothetical protein
MNRAMLSLSQRSKREVVAVTNLAVDWNTRTQKASTGCGDKGTTNTLFVRWHSQRSRKDLVVTDDVRAKK